MAQDAAGSEAQQGASSSPQRPPKPEYQTEPAGVETLVPSHEANDFRSRWDAIQTGFVDDPRRAVEEANQLVDEVTSRVVETFSRGRATLEEQWSRGDEVTTEELRVVLQRYRSFFDGLLRTSTAGS